MRVLTVLLGAGLLLMPANLLAQGRHGMAAQAQEGQVVAGDLVISGGWARAMLPGQKVGGAYLTIANRGAAADRLLSVSSTLARRVEVHAMAVENDVMVMRPVEEGLEIPAGATVELAPGGYHLMLMDVPAPFGAGETVPVELRFERAGRVAVTLPVKQPGKPAPAG